MELKLWFKDANGNEVGGQIAFDGTKLVDKIKNWVKQAQLDYSNKHVLQDYSIAITDDRYRLTGYICSYFQFIATQEKFISLIEYLRGCDLINIEDAIVDYLTLNKIKYIYSGELNGFEILPDFNTRINIK